MLKVMDTDSEQYRIYQTLYRKLGAFYEHKTFPCVLPPLDIFDTQYDYSVASMPMYVSPSLFPWA